ncbi:MAG: hypothetical protein ACYDHX_10215 [Methanothrix sp.]
MRPQEGSEEGTPGSWPGMPRPYSLQRGVLLDSFYDNDWLKTTTFTDYKFI